MTDSRLDEEEKTAEVEDTMVSQEKTSSSVPQPPPPPPYSPPPKTTTSAAVFPTTTTSRQITAPSPIFGGGALRLKVSHKDQGRVVISLANADKTLLQVHIDESVLKYKGIHRSSAQMKDLAAAKSKSKSSSTTTTHKEKEIPKKKSTHTKKPSSRSTSAKPASTTTSTTTRSTAGTSTNRTTDLEPITEQQQQQSSSDKKHRTKTAAAAVVVTSAQSVISNHKLDETYNDYNTVATDDDSTRSPKALLYVNPFLQQPQQGSSPHNSPLQKKGQPEIAAGDLKSPNFEKRWEKRRSQQQAQSQQAKQAQSLVSPSSRHGIRMRSNSSILSNIHEPVEDYYAGGTETKQEITAPSDETAIFPSTPVQQRRLQQRQKRLGKLQRSGSDESFRSTRSVRSSGAPDDGLDPVEATKKPSSAKKSNRVATAARAALAAGEDPNKRTHRHQHRKKTTTTSHKQASVTSSSSVPHEDPDETATAVSNKNKNRRRMVDDIRKVELSNRYDVPATSRRKSVRAGSPDKDDDEGHLFRDGTEKVDPNNNNTWVSKLYGKVLKRRKSHRKLDLM